MMTEVDVPNPRLEIVPGMYAYVSFPLQERQNTLAANIQSISRQGNKAIAYLVDRSDRIEVRTVTTGLETRNQIEVLSGLTDGDRVVVGNTGQLRNGQPVIPKLVDLPEIEGGG
jgi:multidrug efflux pump subunit AcrA (membrane-fusion protein)